VLIRIRRHDRKTVARHVLPGQAFRLDRRRFRPRFRRLLQTVFGVLAAAALNIVCPQAQHGKDREEQRAAQASSSSPVNSVGGTPLSSRSGTHRTRTSCAATSQVPDSFTFSETFVPGGRTCSVGKSREETTAAVSFGCSPYPAPRSSGAFEYYVIPSAVMAKAVEGIKTG